MRSTLGRNLNLCFTKFKRPASAESSSSSSTTPEDHSRPLPNSADTTAASSILIKNFNSLFDLPFDSTCNSKSFRHFSSEEDLLSSSDTSATPDFATVFASQRFFFSSPGRSNSIVDSSSPSSSPVEAEPLESDTLFGGGVAIQTYSPDPFNDFRRSMQEMVEARDLVDVRANWDYLHELLMCYLALNPKSTHKFIVGAFADLLVTLMTSPSKSGGLESDFPGGGCSISRRCM